MKNLTFDPNYFTLMTKYKSPLSNPKDIYISDLLSWAMVKLTPQMIWITVLNHQNVLAVAKLSEVKTIVLAEGVKVDAAFLKKADELQIAIYQTKLPAFYAGIQLQNEKK